MLTTEEAARRLGVKPATIYAYVSRGLLTSERNADGKGSRFAESEIEAFAAARRRPSPAPGESPPIRTGLTLIKAGHLYFRGHDAGVLARSVPYESVATLLWTGQLPASVQGPESAAAPGGAVAPGVFAAAGTGLADGGSVAALVARGTVDAPAPQGSTSALAGRGSGGVVGVSDEGGPGGVRFWPSAELLALAEDVTAPLPAAARLTDRLRVIVAAAAAADPFRFDTSPAAVIATGRTMIGTMVAALPLCGLADGSQSAHFPLAASLWPRLTADAPTPAGIAVLNAALVLLADHDIAASTLAARVAASTRAHPYAVVGAGLAALDGPLHGAASGLAYALLADAVRTGDPVGAISDRQRAGEAVAGFGHRLYPDGDPRAVTLLALLKETSAGPARSRAIIDEVATAVTQRSGAAPNIDFAIAAFALLNGMDANAGEAIFAIARTAGWIAHALEEYADRPSRFRPSGLYSGRTPAS